MAPQLKLVAEPNPRKLRVDSVNIAPAIPNTTATITGAMELGNICLKIVRNAGLPIAMGYGYTSADWVGAAMAGTGILLAGIIILIRKHQ